MKKFELRLKKETLENLNVSEMKNTKAGMMDSSMMDSSMMDSSMMETELWGSRLFCTSNYEGSCKKSKSCRTLICIPF
ncbi:MAG: hypothetical protein NC548_27970 [Lachnospiraceae bacterium]|nr:hypothetical protein [Lachnospiraceae bacterium]